jgi:hypothetical protein
MIMLSIFLDETVSPTIREVINGRWAARIDTGDDPVTIYGTLEVFEQVFGDLLGQLRAARTEPEPGEDEEELSESTLKEDARNAGWMADVIT